MLRTSIKLDVPIFVKALIDDRELPIDDKDAPIATTFALIVDRKALIAHNSHSKDFQNQMLNC